MAISNDYYRPTFSNMPYLDPFNEVICLLNFLKDNLDIRRYDDLIREISCEVEHGEIRDLLTRRVMDNRLRDRKSIV